MKRLIENNLHLQKLSIVITHIGKLTDIRTTPYHRKAAPL